jgi:hypothetical protein
MTFDDSPHVTRGPDYTDRRREAWAAEYSTRPRTEE